MVDNNDEVLLSIHLGNTNTSAAIVHCNGGQIEMVKFQNGSSMLPSVVSYEDNKEVKVGHEAKERSNDNTSRVFFAC